MIKNIDLSKYKRFFAFGCSFTDYLWMTWADIIAREIPSTYKYAKCGAGNFFIFQSLMEAVIKHDIKKDDLVMIMFSNVTREDRFTKERGWIAPGNLYYQDEYDDEFLKKYLCLHGYLMRDLNLVQGCKLALDSIGCDYELMSMVPFHSESSDSKKIDGVDYILKFYKHVIKSVKPSVFELIFNNDWGSRPHRPVYHVPWQKEKFRDNHPTPAEHLEYLQKIYPEIIFSQATLDLVRDMDKFVMSETFDRNQNMAYISRNNCPRLGIDTIYEQ